MPSANPRMQGTETPEFKRWFRDSVVTADGKPGGAPLVVYHGTDSAFEAFDAEADPTMYADDAGRQFFTSSPESASGYAGDGEGANVRPVYLRIERPYMHHVDRDPSEEWDSAGRLISHAADAADADGIIVINDRTGDQLFVTSDPSQIRSSITCA